jgi:putative SOS response-associated peptidase YedK
VGRPNDDRLGIPPEEVARLRAEQEARFRHNRRRWAEATAGPSRGIAAIRRDFVWLYVHCGRPYCGHYAIVPLVPLIIRWGPTAPIENLRRAARCTKCGHKGGATVQNSNSAWPKDLDPIHEAKRWTGCEVWTGEVSHEMAAYKKGFAGEYDFHPVLGPIRIDTMCNLYSNTRSREAVRAWFRVSDNRAYGFEPMPAIFPKASAPIVRLAPDGEREMVPAMWGYPLIRKGYAPRPVTNVRDDTVRTSPFWRPSFEARRCLVPASSYCEPDSNSPAGWHWFALSSGASDAHASQVLGASAPDGRAGQERPLFAFPGIWKRYKGPVRKDGPEVEVDVYAFMTTAPNALTATIMHDRMPVLLADEADFETWLTGSPEAAYGLVRTFAAERMALVQSGSEKRDLLGAEPFAPTTLL